MKKILLVLLTTGFIAGFFFSTQVSAIENENYFVVTAYYSPLPDQENYSYSVYTGRERTYKEEKRLQGEGIRGASGKAVFSGMLAAPKNYKFGTKIYLEGLGVGEVADRGGAIVTKGVRGYSYDRIDVWMGYGDEGLKRASYWGKRTIKGSIIDKNNKINLDYNKIPTANLQFHFKQKTIKNIDIFNKKINSSAEYKKLQEILKEMNMYSGKINGDYKKIMDSIYDFQLDKKIVKSIYSPGAGNYGPITRKALKKEYNLFLVKKEEERLELVRIEKEKQEAKLIIKKRSELSYKKAEEKLTLIGDPKFGEVSHQVRELQVTLKELGYFNNKDTAIYGKITKQSIISYQLDKKIINSSDELGAGIIGPKTKKSLKNDLKEHFLKEIVSIEKKEV